MSTGVERRLWILIAIALAVGLLGSVAMIVLREFLARFATSWG